MMGLSALILGLLCAGLLLGLVVAVLVVWMQNRQESAAHPSGAQSSEALPLPGEGLSAPLDGPASNSTANADDAIEAQIRALMSAGNKLEAIKVYRAATGASLVDAKNAVEALERGEPLPGAAPAAAPETALPVDERIRSLLASGNKIEAIKVYREAYRTGLADAKNAVEALERGEPLPARPPQPPPATDAPLEEQIRTLLAAGQKIEAVKVHRAATGSSLAEALAAVEALERTMKL